MRSRIIAGVGAAAFTVGLSLTGPQALGVASADTGDVDGSSASSGPERGSAARSSDSDAQARPSSRAARSGGRTAAKTVTAPESAADAPTLPAAVTRSRPQTAPSAAVVTAPTGDSAETSPVGTSLVEFTESKPVVGAVTRGGVAPVPVTVSAPVPAAATQQISAPAAPSVAAPASLPTAAATAVVPAAPEIRPTSRAEVVAAVDTVVRRVFDSLADLAWSIPGPISDYLAGGLLVLRRGLFNQAPTASPVQLSTTSAGLIGGSVGAVDPEDDALTYAVVSDPRFGTVAVTEDGRYTYTPGAGYAGSDSFVVKVTETTPGFNILDPRGDRSTDVQIDVGADAETNPFRDGNIADASLLLRNVSAQIAVERTLGRGLTGSVTVNVPDDTLLKWIDETGQIGSITAADVVANWEGIQNAGNVRLGLNYTLDNGDSATVILRSVEASSPSAGQYVFTGVLAPDVTDTEDTNTYFDVIGDEYQSDYDNFLQNVTDLGLGETFSQDVHNAKLYLDTFSVGDYLQEQADSETGLPPATASGAGTSEAQAAATTTAGKVVFDADRLWMAVQFANSGGQMLTKFDPLELLTAPRCRLGTGCKGDFYYFNWSSPEPTALASKSFSLGTSNSGQSVDLSYDLGQSVYGYAFVPDGFWNVLDFDKYSFAALMALTTGPSVTLNLGGTNGTFTYGPQTLASGSVSKVTPYGVFQLSGEVSAKGTAQLSLPKDFTGDSLTAHAYVTGGILLGYNTFSSQPGEVKLDSSYYVDVDPGEFAQISGVSITPTITPKVSIDWGIFVPDTKISLGAVTLSYSNPVSATLALAKNQPPSLTLNASGELGLTAGLVPDLTDYLTYEDSVTLYQVSSGNLLV